MALRKMPTLRAGVAFSPECISFERLFNPTVAGSAWGVDVYGGVSVRAVPSGPSAIAMSRRLRRWQIPVNTDVDGYVDGYASVWISSS